MSDQQYAEAVNTVRDWILSQGKAWVAREPERRCGSSPQLDAAIENLPPDVCRQRPEGVDVIMADLNHYLGREVHDRHRSDGQYCPPR
ncbi:MULTISPECIES: hypothetical protein [Mycolicibacter]|uniref:Uncharacterized protein n=2 Tax=Mycolicibacter TaxID=1073531 RepID=A0ABU5XLB2_9MYCO|nr:MULTISPECIES: hypothetical protein [unclassified Mycolicibacter]MEB3023075.1 hypothetical protein [Mycolicibacter sp. MYC098]MEB3033585.1 hypothetical protein [Mycolicibacter sp. MYC340]